MADADLLSRDIATLKDEQRDAWRELASPTLTTFDRREIRNRIKQGEVELKDYLKMQADRLRFRPRLVPVEATVDSLATIHFRLF